MEAFFAALDQGESIVLLPGAFLSEKTRLLAQGAEHARSSGKRVVYTNFAASTLSEHDEPLFYRALAAHLADQLALAYNFDDEWLDFLGPNLNLELFLKAALEAQTEPILWFLDQVDGLFQTDFASGFFGQIRSWHNRRALQPDGPWSRFTVVIAYASEASELITDPHQSPFNVGYRIPTPQNLTPFPP